MTTPTEQHIIQMLQAAWPAPSPRLGHKLASAPWTPAAVTRRRIATSLAVLAASLLLAASPQGRALAQSLFTYFVPAPATEFVLPPQPQGTLPATATLISEVAPSIQPTGFRRYRSIELAQGLVDFHIYHLAEAPSGFLFRDIGVHHDDGFIFTRYDAAGGGGYLEIIQSTGALPSSAWMEVPAEAIEKVSVAGIQGEYAQGHFVVYPNATSAVWEPTSPIFRLRWGDGTHYFSIEKYGNMPVMTWLDKQAMIELAELLMASQ
ncbi:MAG: hypothetical protein KF701_06265 [Anaerolineales bacterium]|nr:MAG: hypothetical protein KF701_06265 [Anaerolineales bacterium]